MTTKNDISYDFQLDEQDMHLDPVAFFKSQWMKEEMFSEVVSLSAEGNVLASSHFQDENNRGAAQVYKLCDGTWVPFSQEFKGDEDDLYYGNDICLSADGLTVAISGDGCLNVPGKVNVFRYQGERWIELGQEFAGTRGTHFGSAVSLSYDGNILAIGERLYPNGGRVTLYRYSHGEWHQFGDEITPPEGVSDFGVSMDLARNGQFIALGGNGFSDGSRGFVGGYIYKNGCWDIIGKGMWGEPKEYFGSAISLSDNGDILVVGAPGSGKVGVFSLSEGEWKIRGQALFDKLEGSSFGCALALSGDGETLAISNINERNCQGGVYIYRFIKGRWASPLVLSGSRNDEFFGLSIALSAGGRTIACANYRKKNKSVVYRCSSAPVIETANVPIELSE